MRFIDRRPILGQGPLTLMKRLGVEMDRMLEDFDLAHPSTFTPAPRSFEWLPAVELLQKPDQFVVKVELPGLTKDDVKIEVAEGYLTLEGERKQEKTEKREGFLRTERSYGTFFRAIALPEGAKADQAKATFAKGILEIEVPIPVSKPAAARRLPIEEAPEEKKVLVGA
jgi:HSP20 family protein